MTAFGEVAVAVVSSLFVAATLTLLAYLLTRSVRRAGTFLRRELALGAAVESETVGGHDDDPELPSPARRYGILIGGSLIVSGGLRLVGTFVPLYRAVPHEAPSFTLYNTMHYEAITWYAEIAVAIAIGGLALYRRNRIIAAFVVGYCASAIGAVALYAALFTIHGASLGPAYYLLEAGDAFEVVALVTAVVVLLSARVPTARPGGRVARFGVGAALVLAVSSTMTLTRFPGESLWSFSLLPSRMIPATIVEVVVLALVPLLAIRLAGSTPVFVILGLAGGAALSVTDALLERLSPGPWQLTPGFWLTALGAVALIVLVGALRRRDQPVPAVAVAVS